MGFLVVPPVLIQVAPIFHISKQPERIYTEIEENIKIQALELRLQSPLMHRNYSCLDVIRTLEYPTY